MSLGVGVVRGLLVRGRVVRRIWTRSEFPLAAAPVGNGRPHRRVPTPSAYGTRGAVSIRVRGGTASSSSSSPFPCITNPEDEYLVNNLLSSAKRNKKKTALIGAAILLTVGIGGTAATGAYFTDTKTVASNTLTAGTVVLGNINDDATSTTPLAFSNVLPLADSAVATNAQAYNVNIRNNGTAAIKWSVVLNTSSSQQSTTFPQQLNIQYSLDNGNTWSSASTAAALSGTTISGPSALAAGSSTKVQFRAWLPAATDNSAQGQVYKFDLTANAIQTGANP